MSKDNLCFFDLLNKYWGFLTTRGNDSDGLPGEQPIIGCCTVPVTNTWKISLIISATLKNSLFCKVK